MLSNINKVYEKLYINGTKKFFIFTFIVLNLHFCLFQQIYPIRLATCNLHSRQTHSGVSLLVPNINLRQYLATSRGPTIDSSFTALNGVGRYQSEVIKISSSNSTWNRTQASGR